MRKLFKICLAIWFALLLINTLHMVVEVFEKDAPIIEGNHNLIIRIYAPDKP